MLKLSFIIVLKAKSLAEGWLNIKFHAPVETGNISIFTHSSECVTLLTKKRVIVDSCCELGKVA